MSTMTVTPLWLRQRETEHSVRFHTIWDCFFCHTKGGRRRIRWKSWSYRDAKWTWSLWAGKKLTDAHILQTVSEFAPLSSSDTGATRPSWAVPPRHKSLNNTGLTVLAAHAREPLQTAKWTHIQFCFQAAGSGDGQSMVSQRSHPEVSRGQPISTRRYERPYQPLSAAAEDA